MKKLMVCCVACAAAALLADVAKSHPVSEKLRGHEDQEWSEMRSFNLTNKAKKDLPRVLLIGDSITNEYRSDVAKLLDGKVNVTYWISSYCVTSRGYLDLLKFLLGEAKFDVIHFNNGLHSLGTDPKLWAPAFEKALKLCRKMQPQAKLCYVTSTPLKPAALTERAKVLNAEGAKIAAQMKLATDDLFTLIDPLDREAEWSDNFHHKGKIRQMLAEQVAKFTLEQLGK